MRKVTWLVLSLFVVAGIVAASALAAAPQNQTAPSIDGKAMVGQTLTADQGDWSGKSDDLHVPVAAVRQRRPSCGDISGATAKTYKLTDADVGNTVRVQVTATNRTARPTASSKVTDVISGNAAPRATAQPCDLG